MATEKYRILCIFPIPAKSHTTVFYSITDALADRGHELVIVTVFPKKDTRPNVRYIDLSHAEEMWIEGQKMFTQMGKHGFGPMMKEMSKIFKKIFTYEVTQPDIKDLINNSEEQKFDLVLCEVGINFWFAFADIYDAPLIGISSSDPAQPEHEAVGNIVHHYAAPLRWHKSLDLTKFKDRFELVREDLWIRFLAKYYVNYDDTKAERYFGKYSKRYDKWLERIDMLFINVHPATGIIRPLVPKTIPLGFVHLKPAKQLPEALNKFMNESEHGVVYCSLGTQVRTSSLDGQMQTLLKAFEKIKYDVIFKSDTETIEGTPANVRVEKWLPQNDLLAHKNLKLFITQGGQHSMEEAIYHGVPMLTLPFFGDQPLNGRRVAEKGIGEFLMLAKTTPEQLSETINKIIENKSYRDNVENLSKIVQDQPMTSLDKAVWWIEYTVRHKGAKHLAYPGLKVPFYQYYYLDIITAILLVTIACVIGLYFITKFIYGFMTD